MSDHGGGQLNPLSVRLVSCRANKHAPVIDAFPLCRGVEEKDKKHELIDELLISAQGASNAK